MSSPIDACVPGHMANEDFLVIHQVLSHALICPSVDQLLKGDVVRPIIWVWYKYGLLYVICEVTALFDFSKAVMKGPALRQKPQRIDKVASISLNIEIMMFPELS